MNLHSGGMSLRERQIEAERKIEARALDRLIADIDAAPEPEDADEFSKADVPPVLGCDPEIGVVGGLALIFLVVLFSMLVIVATIARQSQVGAM